MPGFCASALFGIPIRLALVLVVFAVVFGLAASLPWLHRRPRQASLLRTLVPHPSQPGSMLAFVSLPMFLYLLRLAFFAWMVIVLPGPVNSPDNLWGRLDGPVGVELTGWRNGGATAVPRERGRPHGERGESHRRPGPVGPDSCRG